ncbi:MAG: aspartate--tRNA ligase [Deltaproteobacteria bacterium]|nr:aspartate--tRNA ligase [Deltaproteobacteria bacterium]
MSVFLATHERTHSCGALRASDAGKRVVLTGWVQNYRDHGERIFIDLRDREGVTQIVADRERIAAIHAVADQFRNEWCIGIVGEVKLRGQQLAKGVPGEERKLKAMTNTKIQTGEVEVWIDEVEVFSKADTPPFAIEDDVDTNDSVRLKYRYLDLRRPRLQRNLVMRSQITRTTRDYLACTGFLEIETPFMVKYTPGGARNFLVPSRLNPGNFYALAESPQIFKQLLMVAGYDRYFQIVRCFRDEDLRNERQPEFTQIDIEMSFVNEKILQTTMEGLMAKLWKDVLGIELTLPLRRMTFAEAMDKYGVDKPDLRLDLILTDVTEGFKGSGIKFIDDAIAAGGIVKALRIPKNEKFTRALIDELPNFGKQYGLKGVTTVRLQEGGVWQGLKGVPDEARAAITAKVGAQVGDAIVFVADKWKVANTALGGIRLHLGDKLGLIRKNEWQFMWLTDPPLFEVDEGEIAAAHHPFTSPRTEDEDMLETAPEKVLARAYDLVLNGVEVGGGSIRIHRSDLQARAFKALRISDENQRAKFGFLLDAFKFGPPPHGGIAFGLDRLAMLMTGAEYMRDVIAFPKTQKGSDLMTDCPTPVSAKQLDELFIQVKPDLPVK